VPARLRIPLLALFLLSGTAGLIHEIAWTRVLRHVLGGSSLALTTVLIAFLGGMAIGATWVARRIPRLRSPLAVFAWVEWVIAAWTVLLPTLLDASWPLWRALYVAGPGVGFTVARFVVSLVLLAPAAIAMGASLPLLAAIETSDSRRRGKWVAGLYGFNALGAALGALAAGFILLPALGLSTTIHLAAGLNFVVGLAAFLLARKQATDPRPLPAPVPGAHAQHRLLGLYMLAAASLFMHEIAWARVATLLLGSTIYAFSLLLAVIVAGLALGGLLATRSMKTADTAKATLAVTQGLIAIAGLATVAVVPWLPYAITRWFAQGSAVDAAGLGVVAAVVAGMFLGPSVLMGLAYPLVCRAVLGNDVPGRPAARVQAVGNLGAVVGVLAAGLVVMPWLGLRNTLIVAAALNAVVAVSVGRLAQRRGRRISVAFAVVWLIVLIASPRWDPARVSLGPFVQARRQPLNVATSSDALKQLEAGQQVLFHHDGRESSLTVKQTPHGERSLWINGKPDASSVSDMATQRLLAHIPLLLHEDPKRALILGLGSGVTSRSAAAHPLQRIDIVEISADARRIAALFEDVNGGVLEDPRVNLIVADGRLHLALTDQRYDVIVSEPSNPWIAGIGDLYTQEFFGHVRDRLAPGGLFCLWLPAYHLDIATFRAVAATFLETFPASTLWHTQGSDYLLVGALEFPSVDPASLSGKMQSSDVQAELWALGIEGPPSLLANLVLEPSATAAFVAGAGRNTDDNALLEYTAPQRLLANPDEAALLLAIERARGSGLEFFRSAPAWLSAARAARSARGAAIRASLLLAAGETPQGLDALREAAAANPADAFLEQTLAANQRHADALAAAGQITEAIARYRLLLDVAPTRAATRDGLAELLEREGR
jgi:spermidine synthase